MTIPNIAQQLVKGLVVSKWFTISPSKDDDRSKRFKLELTITDVTVLDMANGLLASEVIKVQNTKRSKWDKLVNNTTFKKTFKRPLVDIDPEEAMVASLLAMSPEAREAKLAELAKKAKLNLVATTDESNVPSESTSE